MPATGNHDEATKNAQGYWDYFGSSGGPYDKYYYSYDLGSWHVVVLNSDCWRVDGCAIDDPQAEWLRHDLEQHPTLCTLAYWHRPPFSSGRYGAPNETARVRPLWRVLNERGRRCAVDRARHSYERFAPMDAEGKPTMPRVSGCSSSAPAGATCAPSRTIRCRRPRHVRTTRGEY